MHFAVYKFNYWNAEKGPPVEFKCLEPQRVERLRQTLVIERKCWYYKRGHILQSSRIIPLKRPHSPLYYFTVKLSFHHVGPLDWFITSASHTNKQRQRYLVLKFLWKGWKLLTHFEIKFFSKKTGFSEGREIHAGRVALEKSSIFRVRKKFRYHQKFILFNEALHVLLFSTNI